MRINAFCSLERPDPHVERIDEIFGIEKGNVRMSFGVSSVLQRLLREWMTWKPPATAVGRGQCYLFPARNQVERTFFMPRFSLFFDHPDIHMSTSTARRTFHRVAARAGVVGPHVHPHTDPPSATSAPCGIHASHHARVMHPFLARLCLYGMDPLGVG